MWKENLYNPTVLLQLLEDYPPPFVKLKDHRSPLRELCVALLKQISVYPEKCHEALEVLLKKGGLQGDEKTLIPYLIPYIEKTCLRSYGFKEPVMQERLVKILTLLHQAGAELEKKSFSNKKAEVMIDDYYYFKDDQPLLPILILSRRPVIVKGLFPLFKNVFFIYDGLSVLHLAVYTLNIEIVKAVLQNPCVDLNKKVGQSSTIAEKGMNALELAQKYLEVGNPRAENIISVLNQALLEKAIPSTLKQGTPSRL